MNLWDLIKFYATKQRDNKSEGKTNTKDGLPGVSILEPSLKLDQGNVKFETHVVLDPNDHGSLDHETIKFYRSLNFEMNPE